MKRPSPAYGALLGGLTSLPLIALFYLGKQGADLPFVPFDLFDWLARVLPGGVVRLGIDTMVRTIGALGLGPTDSLAKAMEQLTGIVLSIVLAAALGALIAWLIGRADGAWRGWRLGMIVAGAVWVLVIALILSLRSVVAGDLLWTAVLLLGWGGVVGALLQRSGDGRPAPAAADAGAGSAGRRGALIAIAGGSLGVALAAWGLGRLLAAGTRQSGAGLPLSSVEPQRPVPTPPPTPAGRPEPAPGTRPEVTATDRFYRIDINTLPPHVDGRTWTLTTKGLFDQPRSLTLADLLAYPAVTQPITLQCISNPVAGDLTSTAYWTGLRLRDLVADLGLQSAAQALFVKAADGFYESISLQDVMNDRTLLVYAMNGESLPVDHGYPLRVYIPNRYGMKQPKWIVSIEAAAEPRPGYWVERGWSREARPQIVSVIDAVAEGGPVDAKVPLGGIAWAGDRGIQKVEVQVDDGPWAEAVLRVPPLGPLTWVQWRYDWPYAKGRHVFTVRATDGTGTLQTADVHDTYPDGATGYHSVAVNL